MNITERKRRTKKKGSTMKLNIRNRLGNAQINQSKYIVSFL